MQNKETAATAAREIEPIYLGPESNKSGRFITLSVLIHAAMMASVTFLSLPKFETPRRDIVEFEVASETIGPKAILDGAPVEATQGLAPKAAPVAAAQPEVAPPMPESVPVAPKAVVAAKVAPVQAPAPVRAAAPAVAAAAQTIDDIQTPDLETSDSGEVAVAQLDEKDLNDDFEKVDHAHNKKLKAVQKNLDDEADKVAAENAAALAKAEKENQEEAQAVAAANDARRAKDAKDIAAAQATEKASAEKAAREAAAQEAKEAALAAKSAAAAGQGNEGEGSGATGSPAPTKEVAGIPGGVRALGQLRQLPGNRLPQYDREERLQGHQGSSIFYAYVNKDGSLSQFKMGQSTGHRNLDVKTLAALKKWKFYPGQEGWVEMPYEWVLKGDSMEAGGTLRK